MQTLRRCPKCGGEMLLVLIAKYKDGKTLYRYQCIRVGCGYIADEII